MDNPSNPSMMIVATSDTIDVEENNIVLSQSSVKSISETRNVDNDSIIIGNVVDNHDSPDKVYTDSSKRVIQ